MEERIKRAAEAVSRMEQYLETVLPRKKSWGNTYIKKQIDKRERGESFDMTEHIRGMVYAMLSSNFPWERVEQDIDDNSGRILSIDKIFHDYDIDVLLSHPVEKIRDEIKEKKLAGLSTNKQMKGLIPDNINLLKSWEDSFGSIDGFYQKFIEEDPSYKILVKTLSQSDSENKMKEMSEALTAEYLRNIGHDIAKPDRHIRRILGRDILACSEEKMVPVYEVMDIVREIADTLNEHVAEVDYTLWSYCAKSYGEICTSKRPGCCECVIRGYCSQGREKPCQKIQA